MKDLNGTLCMFHWQGKECVSHSETPSLLKHPLYNQVDTATPTFRKQANNKWKIFLPMGQNIISLTWKKSRWVMKRTGLKSTKTLETKGKGGGKSTFYLRNRISKQKPTATKAGQDRWFTWHFHHQDRKQSVYQQVKNSAEVPIWLVSISLY